MSGNITCTVEEARARAEASRARSAWERGVKEYALELMQDLDGSEALDLKTLEKRLLNGADDWQHYSAGASALVYDEDIAERLFPPSRRRRAVNAGGLIEAQGRALAQAYRLVRRAVREAHALNARAAC